MAATDEQDEQPRSRWPLNSGARSAGALASGLRDNAGARGDQTQAGESEPDPNAAAVDVDTRVDESGGAREPGKIDDRRFDSRLYRGGQVTGLTETDRAVLEQEARPAQKAAVDTQGAMQRGSLGSAYDSGLDFDDTVLGGLHYTTAVRRLPVHDERWAASLRTFARAAIWCLPVASLLLALSAAFGWPTTIGEPSLISPGGWVILTSFGLGLWVIGVMALAALVAPTTARRWAWPAVAVSALGVALLAPAVGVTGLARPAIRRTAAGVANDGQISTAAGQMQSQLLDNTTGRFLIVAGSALLLLGAVALAATILRSRVLTQHDAWLVLLGVAIAIAAAYASLQFLFVIAALFLLAGTLGLAYTASRIAPDGTAATTA